MARCRIKTSDIDAPAPCENNLPGVQRLFFTPREDIESINALAAARPESYGDRVIIGSPALAQRAITVKSGKEFGEIYCAEELGELVYTPQGQKGSRSFKAELEIFHPGFKKEILGFLAAHNNQELVLVVQLVNGDWHLVGDSRRGASLTDSTRATSGKACTDANGAECHFECSTQAPRVFYNGWDPEDEAVGIERFRIAYVLATEDGYAITTEDGYMIEI